MVSGDWTIISVYNSFGELLRCIGFEWISSEHKSSQNHLYPPLAFYTTPPRLLNIEWLQVVRIFDYPDYVKVTVTCTTTHYIPTVPR